MVVPRFPDDAFDNRWLDHRGVLECPLRLSDLTTLEFFFGVIQKVGYYLLHCPTQCLNCTYATTMCACVQFKQIQENDSEELKYTLPYQPIGLLVKLFVLNYIFHIPKEMYRKMYGENYVQVLSSLQSRFGADFVKLLLLLKR